MKKQAAVLILALCMCAGCSSTSNKTADSQKSQHGIFSGGANFGGSGSINKGAGPVGR